ncbi:MAG TPA: phosphatase PAP2 family protein [Gaiellaceae bacterium]|nr:phosphatase PAP2 family protein [Gaiellaceae bacterium]
MPSHRTLRIGAPVAWGVATIVLVVLWGVPVHHDLVFLWLFAGMAAFSFEPTRVVRDWLPVVAILFVYDLLRGAADGLLMPPRESPQIRLEAALFGRPIPTVWLQQHLWHGRHDLRWYDYATWFLHLTHFVASFVVLAAFWVFKREHFARFAAMICTLSIAGYLTYVLYPAVPPWMAAQHGNVGESNRIIASVWHQLPVSSAGAVFEHGKSYANNVAAMPSLHAAFALLLVLYVWRFVPRLVRPLLLVYPLAMSVALVYAGEHYVVDCVAGFAYAGATFVAVNKVWEWREARAPALEPAFAD